ncbi:hypothetical protein HanIR_Chr03g0134121 [Helianthus annuus]|nr:hypothetical protein HanIR_Chr03g0134121 [Helianthus annuus]
MFLVHRKVSLDLKSCNFFGLQSEYSRKVCFMMLTMETRLKNPMLSNSAAITVNPSVPVDSTAQTDNPNNGDWQEEVYQKIKAMQKLYLLESDDWKAQLQDSSSLPSALPPGNDVRQPTLTNVSGHNFNMQNIQNMSSVAVGDMRVFLWLNMTKWTSHESKMTKIPSFGQI